MMEGKFLTRKVIITGLSGFVGSNLQKYMKDEYEMKSLSVRFILNQKFDFKREAIIHLAGKAHDLKNVDNSRDYYEANFELTKQLFDAFLVSESKIFIFMSTVKAVADQVDEILTEKTIPNPKTHYGISKHMAEEYILSKELPKSKRIYILRPCMIHGPGNKGNLNLLYEMVAKGLPWPLGVFQNRRSFLSIENLCFVIKQILENEKIPSGIYQLADNKSISTNEVIKLLGTSLGKKTKIWNVKAIFIKKFARIGDFLHLPLNSERLQKLTESYIVSNEKIIKALGQPLPITTEIGLIKTFQSFRSNK